MGNVNEPYMSSNRFEVAFSSNMATFRLELTITGSYYFTIDLQRMLVLLRFACVVSEMHVLAHCSTPGYRRPMLRVQQRALRTYWHQL